MILFLTGFLLSVLLPGLIALWLGKREKLSVKMTILFLVIGAFGWIIAKFPKGIVIIPVILLKGLPLQMNAEQFEQLLKNDLSFLIVGAVSAGVFEELFKPIGLILFKKDILSHSKALVGWIVGAGCGILETIALLGGEVYKILSLGIGNFTESLYMPVERFLIILFHAALTSILVYFIARRRYLIGFGLPILMHFAIDLIIPYLQVKEVITNIWLIELIIFIWVLLLSSCSGYLITRETRQSKISAPNNIVKTY